jgi:MoxR-like ATPase
MLQVKVDLPDETVERRILDLVDQETLAEPSKIIDPISMDVILSARLESRSVYLSSAIKDYIVRLVTAPRNKKAHADLSLKIEHPASPRGTIALAMAAKARAYIKGRDFVLPDDISALAIDVLSHRTILSWRALSDGDSARAIIADYLERVPLT